MTQPATRRTVLATGAGALALGCAGCGGGKDGGATAPASAVSPAGQEAAPVGQALTTTDDIPEGGGKVFKEQKVVVTQPKKGDFKAFSAICSHQGCTVSEVTDGAIACPCHGSSFRIADGSVVRGPATSPLEERSVTVDGNSIRLD
jgi:Rieske Fe-S protein